MSKQRHDKGRQKAQRAGALRVGTPSVAECDAMARELVRRGLAGPTILAGAPSSRFADRRRPADGAR